MTSPITHEQLDTLFAPKSVALIGASDKSLFSWNAFGVMQRFGWGDRMYLVNPNKPQVHGTTTYASCADVPGGFDCAFIMLPQELVPQAIDDAAAVGARGAIVLTSGYAEVDDAGAAARHDPARSQHAWFRSRGLWHRGMCLGRSALHSGKARLDLPKRRSGQHAHAVRQQ
jgi:acyl-CoA synthetase (NDP forming)